MSQHTGGAAATQSVVKVQVGEKEFRFKRTLFPEDSLIPTMLRGGWLETSPGGVPFLDLDPAIFGIIVNHFRTQQLSDVRLDIFKFVEESQRAPLWHTLKYLLLLPHLCPEPLHQVRHGGAEVYLELRCWIYEVDIRGAHEPITLELYDLLIQESARRVAVRLGEGVNKFQIDMIHDQIVTPVGPVSTGLVDYDFQYPLSAFSGLTGRWRVAVKGVRSENEFGGPGSVSVRGLHE